MPADRDDPGVPPAPPAGGVSEYRMAPLLVARFVGAYLVVLAVVVLAATTAVAAVGLPPDLLVVLLAVGLVGLFTLGWWLRTRVAMVRLTDRGYRVRLVRGAGTREAAWSEVEDVVAATPRDIVCLVIRLRDGRTTTVPVEALAVDRDELARDVRARLRRTGRPGRRGGR